MEEKFIAEWKKIQVVQRGDVRIEITESSHRRPRYAYTVCFSIQDQAAADRIVRHRVMRWDGTGSSTVLTNAVNRDDLVAAVAEAEGIIRELIAGTSAPPRDRVRQGTHGRRQGDEFRRRDGRRREEESP